MSPACSGSAPQQPCFAGVVTLQPSAASTFTVARFTSSNDSRCTQPVSTATFMRASPTAGVCSGMRRNIDNSDTGGDNASAAATRLMKLASSGWLWRAHIGRLCAALPVPS